MIVINWVDIVIAIIIIYNLIRGFSLGFIRLIFGILGYIVAFFVSKQYHRIVTDYVIENVVYFHNIKENVSFKISESFGKTLTETNINNNLIEGFNLPKILDKDFEKMLESTTGSETVNNISSNISDFIVYGLGAVAVFFLVLFLVKIIGAILNSFAELPIIKEANKFAGFLFGGVKGILFVFLIMTLLAFLSPVIAETTLMIKIQSSKFGIYFYNNNLLLKLINMYLLS